MLLKLDPGWYTVGDVILRKKIRNEQGYVLGLISKHPDKPNLKLFCRLVYSNTVIAFTAPNCTHAMWLFNEHIKAVDSNENYFRLAQSIAHAEDLKRIWNE